MLGRRLVAVFFGLGGLLVMSMPAVAAEPNPAIRPFRINVQDANLTELCRRVRAMGCHQMSFAGKEQSGGKATLPSSRLTIAEMVP
jgi:hypothetical protein